LQKAPVCTRQVAKGADPPYLQKAPESQLQKAPDSGARPPFAKGAKPVVAKGAGREISPRLYQFPGSFQVDLHLV
jgi:hypothetical protein